MKNLKILDYETGDEIPKERLGDLKLVFEDYIRQLREWAENQDNCFSAEGIEEWKRNPIIHVVPDWLHGYQAVDPSGAEIGGFYITLKGGKKDDNQKN